MKLSAVIMAGGKSTRFDFKRLNMDHEEKTLLMFRNKTMIEHVIKEVAKVERIKRIIVATSFHTPKTKELLEAKNLPIEIIQTPGMGYHQDLKYLVNKLELKQVITITSDIPLISKRFLDQIIDHYEAVKKPALSVMSSKDLYQKCGLQITRMEHHLEENENLVPLGINIIDGALIDKPYMDEIIYLNEEEELIFNINTFKDYLLLKKKFGETILK